MKQFIKKNTKTHEIKRIQTEQYEVNFANTERLNKSPIIYMQNLLNEI